MTTSRLVLGQMDINAVNKPVELLNSANEDIENGNYTVSGWANTSCRFDFSQERSLCLSYVYVQW